MKLTKGRVIAGENMGNGVTDFTIRTAERTTITLCEDVTTFSLPGFDESRLKVLYDYLINRPALMDDKEVKGGVLAISYLLGLKT